MTLEFGKLSRKEKLNLFTAWLDGEIIEYSKAYDWKAVNYPVWLPDCRYRIKPKADKIPWSQISDNFKWAARNSDGEVYVYSILPRAANRRWSCPVITKARIDEVFKDFEVGNIEWDKSLQERPR